MVSSPGGVDGSNNRPPLPTQEPRPPTSSGDTALPSEHAQAIDTREPARPQSTQPPSSTPLVQEALRPSGASSTGAQEGLRAKEKLPTLESLFDNPRFTASVAARAVGPALAGLARDLKAAVGLLGCLDRLQEQGRPDYPRLGQALRDLSSAVSRLPPTLDPLADGQGAVGLLRALRALGTTPQPIAVGSGAPLSDEAFSRVSGSVANFPAVRSGERDFVTWCYDTLLPLLGECRRLDQLGEQLSESELRRRETLRHALGEQGLVDAVAAEAVARLRAEAIRLGHALVSEERFASHVATLEDLHAEWQHLKSRVAAGELQQLSVCSHDALATLERLFCGELPRDILITAACIAYGVVDVAPTDQPGWGRFARITKQESITDFVRQLLQHTAQEHLQASDVRAAVIAYNGLALSAALGETDVVFVPSLELISAEGALWSDVVPMHGAGGSPIRRRLLRLLPLLAKLPPTEATERAGRLLKLLAHMPAGPPEPYPFAEQGVGAPERM